LLDFYNALAAAVRGQGEGADELAAVNERLRALFECVWIHVPAPDKKGNVHVQPVLHQPVILEEGESDTPVYMIVTGDERIVPPVRELELSTERDVTSRRSGG